MTNLTAVTSLNAGMFIVARLPITVTGQKMTPANAIAEITVVETTRSRLKFADHHYETWADNDLLLNNFDQFINHVEGQELPLAYDFVTTSEGLFLVVDIEGNEVARAVSEDMAKHIAEALVNFSA